MSRSEARRDRFSTLFSSHLLGHTRAREIEIDIEFLLDSGHVNEYVETGVYEAELV